MELSYEQQLAFQKYAEGRNVFITGPGGTGKSELIRRIYQHASSRFKDIHVCALTGCAAILLSCKAKTLHSWSGIGLGNLPIESLIKKIKGSNFLRALWKDTDILVVDEVSMLSLHLFNLLNQIGKVVRGNSKPFGGIQLIFSGDFYQLPPVGNRDEPETMQFCFESTDWNSTFSRECQIQLIKIFRQKDDVYSTILNQIRVGKIKRKSNDLLLRYVGREYDKNLVAEPTKLFPTKIKVETINNTKMAELSSKETSYEVKYHTDLKMTTIEKSIRREFNELSIKMELDFLASNLICEKDIKIKVGCQVMCVVNVKSDIDDSLEICNGSQGVVTGFCSATGFPFVKFNNGIEKVMPRHTWLSDKIPGVGVSQVPLILAWALTIHKSQGATLDTAEIDVGSGIFECGQTYVALSRVKSLDGLYLTSFDAKRIRISKKVQEFYEKLTEFQDAQEKPNVEIPTVFAEPIAVAQQIGVQENPFVDFQYIEATQVELVDEKYEE
jgi:ATP-dependent DNA helicase PIF1